MSNQFLLINTPVVLIPAQTQVEPEPIPQSSLVWMTTSVGLLLLVMSIMIYYQMKLEKQEKKLNFEKIRAGELQKKLKLALQTLHKIESNPDLINSRDVNLDYLRMRMAEEMFHKAVLHQIKIKVKDKISQALMPSQARQGYIGVPSTVRQVDETFDVDYEPIAGESHEKRVLFRVQIQLMKLPTQRTSTTIEEIITCIQTYLSPTDDYDTWQPTIQSRIVSMHWDQQAKPTPMLVIEQSSYEGNKVTFATRRQRITTRNPTPEWLNNG